MTPLLFKDLRPIEIKLFLYLVEQFIHHYQNDDLKNYQIKKSDVIEKEFGLYSKEGIEKALIKFENFGLIKKENKKLIINEDVVFDMET